MTLETKTTNKNHLKGFASLSPERRSEIASAGGRAAHEKGLAHQFTSEEARAAGRKGGEANAKRRAERAAIRRANAVM
jgi:general stress protein YciG